jgi:hypothetical protein
MIRYDEEHKPGLLGERLLIIFRSNDDSALDLC